MSTTPTLAFPKPERPKKGDKKADVSPPSTAPAKRKRTSVLASHEQEFVEKVIQPKLLQLFDEFENGPAGCPPSMSELTAAYSERFAEVSETTMRRWVEALGWSYERIYAWSGLPETTDAEPVAQPTNPNFGEQPPLQGKPVSDAELAGMLRSQ